MKTVAEGWAAGHFLYGAPLLVKSPPIHVDDEPNIQHRVFCPLVTAPKFGRTMSEEAAEPKSHTTWSTSLIWWMPMDGVNLCNVCTHLRFHFWLLSNYRYFKICKREPCLPCSPPPQHVRSSLNVSLNASLPAFLYFIPPGPNPCLETICLRKWVFSTSAKEHCCVSWSLKC